MAGHVPPTPQGDAQLSEGHAVGGPARTARGRAADAPAGGRLHTLGTKRGGGDGAADTEADGARPAGLPPLPRAEPGVTRSTTATRSPPYRSIPRLSTSARAFAITLSSVTAA